MAIIKCNNTCFNDSRHNVPFKLGEAHTEDERAIEWFKSNGYQVLDEPKTAESKSKKAVKVND